MKKILSIMMLLTLAIAGTGCDDDDNNVAINTLPQAVTTAIAAEYPDYRIDDAEYTDTPDGAYYSIELEKGERDVYIKVAPDGTIK